MLGDALASILKSQLGQYLDTEELNVEVSVFANKPVILQGVKLKESAFRDLDLPLRCKYGKIERLSIDIPWTSVFNKPTKVEVKGLYMLLVPTTSVGYDAEKEERAEQEAKMAKISAIEEAKERDKLLEQQEAGDTFIQKLMAGVFRHLEVTVTDVHIRYEDTHTNAGDPFGAGLTMDRLVIRTNKEHKGGDDSKHSFKKEVKVDSLAVYWQPQEKNIYSEGSWEDETLDSQFRAGVAGNEAGVAGLNYLLGPISLQADMTWIPEPKRVDFSKPQIALDIVMAELKLEVTKLQYHDFAMLLHSLNGMKLAARYRKYKAAVELEGVTNYEGKGKQLWQYAAQSILEEEVRPRLRNWSQGHIRAHLANCREYRDLYRDKLLHPNDPARETRLCELEKVLDAFNINFNRERAKLLADADKQKKEEKAKSGWFGWMGWGKGKKGEEVEGSDLAQAYQALTPEEKKALYEAIDYHEDAEEGILAYPRRFVKFRVKFQLKGFTIRVRDEDLAEACVLELALRTVNLQLSQRPAASNFLIEVSMESLTVKGLHSKTSIAPTLVKTVRRESKGGSESNLLTFSFETNPPKDPLGDLDHDLGSFYDRNLMLRTSPLEITWHTRTLHCLLEVFRLPQEVRVGYLQESTIDSIKEYKDVKMSQLGWQFVREHHVFFKVDIELESSYFIFPKNGEYREGCSCLIANLGKVVVSSKEVTQAMADTKKEEGKEEAMSTLKSNEEAYDRFSIQLKNMELLLAHQGEDWRAEMLIRESKLFVLKPIDLEVNFHICLIPNDPSFPVYKLSGSLPRGIAVCIEERRLITAAEIAQDILDPDDEMKGVGPALTPVGGNGLRKTDSESSFRSAVSSIGTQGSQFIGRKQVSGVVLNVPQIVKKKEKTVHSNVTKLDLDFSIATLNLDIEEAERPLFRFKLDELGARLTVKQANVQGKFEIGGCLCEQAKFKMPSGSPVPLLSTEGRRMEGGEKLLTVHLARIGEKSPAWNGEHQKVVATLSSVSLCLHQDAILDLAKEATRWTQKVRKRAAKLMGPADEGVEVPDMLGAANTGARLSRQPVFRKQLSRQSSIGEEAGQRNSLGTSLIRQNRVRGEMRRRRNPLMARVKEEVVNEVKELVIQVNFKGVSADLMTEKHQVANLEVADLQTIVEVYQSKTSIMATLREVKVTDLSRSTIYKTLVESSGKEVFNVKVEMYENLTKDERDRMNKPDVKVIVRLGQLKGVFLMKFINDFLLFIDPFTNMKEFIYEQTVEAYEGASRIVGEAITDKSKVCLDICMEAPIIILPVSSRNPFTFEANLGKLTLVNDHRSTPHFAHTILTDVMTFKLSEMTLARSRVAEDMSDNSTLGTATIIRPISFELEITRNMEGAFKENDLPEVKIEGTLHKIEGFMSKGDYNTLIALVTTNFQEVGTLEKAMKTSSLPPGMTLPLHPRPKLNTQGSRVSLISNNSIRDVMEGLSKDKSPQAKIAEFNFDFKGFGLTIYKDKTDLTGVNMPRDERKALATIKVLRLTVEGNYKVSGALRATIKLEDVVLEDVRNVDRHRSADRHRITKLFEAKKVGGDRKKEMIKVEYRKDKEGQELVDVHVSGFVVVASVSYLLEIANFFVPEEMTVASNSGPGAEDLPDDDLDREASQPNTNTRTVTVKVEEPDIVLVDNIEDVNTDALMLNAELSINLTQAPDRMSLVLIVDRLRGHTCKFNPALREQTLVAILQQTTMGLHMSQDTEANRMRIDINFNHLVFNVSPASIYIIYNSYNTFMAEFFAAEADCGEESACEALGVAEDNLWATMPFQEDELWYLKPDDAIDALGKGTGGDVDSLASTVSQMGDQQLMFNINQLIVTVEAGIGNCTIPTILLESKVSGEVRNWSGRLSVVTIVQLEMAYYNSKLALWEPVLEPVERQAANGRTQHTRWSLEVRYHANSRNELGSAILSPNFEASDENDGFVCPENLPPLTEIGIHSTETLQITLTKSFLAVLKTLVESFSPSAMEQLGQRESGGEGLVVVNECGRKVTLVLGENRNFAFLHSGEQAQPEVESGARKVLNLRFNRHSSQDSNSNTRSYISPLRNQNDQSEATLKIRVSGEAKKSFEVPINKADSRFFKFVFRGDETGEEQGIVSTVTVENGTKFVTLTSILTFKNSYPHAVNIWQEDKNRLSVACRLEKDATWNVPVSHVYTEMGRFFFSLDGPDQNMGMDWFSWKEIGKSKGSNVKKKIECGNTAGDPPVFLNIEGVCQEIFNERASELTQRRYLISVRPSVVLKNCLPIPLYYTTGAKAEYKTLEQGEIGTLEDMIHEQTLLRFQLIGWRQVDLQCTKVFDNHMKQLEYWRFEAAEATASNLRVDLGVMKEVSRGTTVLSIFAPFWFVNKTQRRLHFKGHDGTNELIHYPEEAGIPMIFSFLSKSFLGKKKICLKVEDSMWSDPFPVDTIGDTGRIVCKLDTRRGSLKSHFKKEKIAEDAFNVGIQISQSTSSFTKIVTFTPYFMIFNDADFDIILKEVEDELDGVVVGAGQCVPFWPIYGGQSVVCQAVGCEGFTVPFSLKQIEPTLLMLANRFGGIYVRVKTDNSSQTLVSLSGYRSGQAPILLVNATPSWTIEYGEAGLQDRTYLAPGMRCLFTWKRPSGPRTLVWSINGIQGSQRENSLRTDECDVFKIGNGQFAWVSFLDGMQRVLLFTGQPVLARSLAKTTGESERIEQEMDVSIYGIGLSIVNNDDGVRRELAYLSVRSSDVVWEVRREGKQRYKSLTTAQCQAIERDFLLYSRRLAIGKTDSARREVEGGIVVNYVDERMEAPHKGRLRRQFQKGLWFQMRTSQHQRQFHLKVNHVQLDNQLHECLYPVIAAPVPPPRSVTAVSVPKPFVELSILEYTSPEHRMKQYKYIHALVQEMHLKVELGFINALAELLEEEEILEENTAEKLDADLHMARKELKEHAVLSVSQGNKDFYDYLHLSPLKVHVSLSFTTYNTRRDGTSVTRGSNFINLLLQSFGVTITDTNDIIFRLAYFERKHQFFNLDDLTSEITCHYTSQAIKQMYVVLLGLDVLGNPFGLVVGVARSVEDLFYEPFQGAVEGPSEFAEGLAIGVRSVFSGVVGGGAGFVSKITGAIGKGLAAATFDQKFQQKRREAIKRRANQDNLAVGMARNTKGLAEGFFGGITGVVTKPVDGAREDGVGGFFKGVGKGMVGLVTRPVGGAVDFASGTFDTVKRATEVNDEFVRTRTARYIHPDGVVRYYDRREAEGAKIVRQMDKGRVASDIYLLHEVIFPGKEVFLLTNKRAVYAVANTVLGGWSSDWEYLYHEIHDMPTIQQEGTRWFIIIHPKEERKSMMGLFGKTSGKKIFLPEGSNKESAQMLARTIEDLRLRPDNFDQVFLKMVHQKANK